MCMNTIGITPLGRLLSPGTIPDGDLAAYFHIFTFNVEIAEELQCIQKQVSSLQR